MIPCECTRTRSTGRHLLFYPLSDVGLQPDNRVRPDGILLGKGALSHPFVNSGATYAYAIQDFEDDKKVRLSYGACWHDRGNR